MTSEEKRIIDGLLNRDEKITKEFFFTKCRPSLNGILHEVFRDTRDYDEMINDLYLYLMADDGRRLRTFGTKPINAASFNDGEAKALLAWLRTTARRFFIEISRKEREKTKLEKIEWDENGDLLVPDPEDRSVKDPTAGMDTETLLSHISPKDRNVVQKYYLEDMDVEELSKEFGIPEALFYNWKKRAMDRLRKIARHASGPESLCTIVCEQYALDVFGIHKSLQALRDCAREKGWIEESGMALSNFGKLSAHFGLKVRSGLATFEELTSALERGIQVIVAVDGGELTGDPVEERLEDVFAAEVSDHTVVVLTIDSNAKTVSLYDPSYGTAPLTVEEDRFIDAWNDSGNFALLVEA